MSVPDRHEQCLNFGANVNVNDFQEAMSITDRHGRQSQMGGENRLQRGWGVNSGLQASDEPLAGAPLPGAFGALSSPKYVFSSPIAGYI